MHLQWLLAKLKSCDKEHAMLQCVILFLLLMTPAISFAEESTLIGVSMVELLLLMIVLLVLSAIFLQRSVIKHKHAKQELEKARQELQFLVVQRTRRLNEVNHALQSEVNLQEETSRSLMVANELLDSILSSMPSMLVAITPDGEVTHWNKASELITGFIEKDALGHPLHRLCPDLPIDWNELKDTIDCQSPLIKENLNWRGISCDITIYPLTGGGSRGAVLRIDDVTTRTTVETIMIHNEKMLALGQMAAGAAHEVNNPLATILQSLQNAERRLFSRIKSNNNAAEKVGLNWHTLQDYLVERDIQRIFADMRSAGERATEIVTNMLSFSRRSSQTFECVDLDEIIANTLILAKQNIAVQGKGRDKVKIKVYPSDIPISLECLTTEIQQVLLNLITNAEQALQGFDTGLHKKRISIRTYVDENNVRIEVEDNGPGIPEDIRQHIFEPFFTTKIVGSGTGLGLSVSYFIITKHHGGSIHVESADEGGSIFVVILPKFQGH